jgi:hypothetical protein
MWLNSSPHALVGTMQAKNQPTLEGPLILRESIPDQGAKRCLLGAFLAMDVTSLLQPSFHSEGHIRFDAVIGQGE